MKTKTYSLVIIIILLCIFVPLTIFGYVYKKNNTFEENPNHDFYFQGKLYFYNENNELVNKYTCNNAICELAKSSTEDNDKYKINYYKDGNMLNIPITQGGFAFIQDGDLVYLYNYISDLTLHGYTTINNYNTGINDSLFIVKDNDNYGVLKVSENVDIVIPFEYSFIGLKNKINENNNIDASTFIVNKNNSWYLIDREVNDLSVKLNNPIIDYNNKYIITYSDNYQIYDYNGNEYTLDMKINDYILEDNYIGIINNKKLYIYKDLNDSYIKEFDIKTNKDNIKFKMENDRIIITENDEELGSL